MHLGQRFFWLFAAASLAPLAANAQRNPDIQLYYELLSRIELLEREIRQLRGDLETFQYRSQQGGQLGSSDTYDALERRITALERIVTSSSSREIPQPTPAPVPQATFEPPTAPASPIQSPAPQPAPAPSVRYTPPSQDEQEAYNVAFGLLRDGRYEIAIEGFQDFISVYPNSALTGDAYYWLGESLYVIREFESAKRTFLTLGSRYPNNDKVPDALLKLGYIYIETGDNNRARQVLQKLTETYPDTQAASLATKQLRLLR